jgi:hypothetical protein
MPIANARFAGATVQRWDNRLCRADSLPEEAANYLLSIMQDEPIPDADSISRDDIIKFLKGKEGSLSAIPESLTETYIEPFRYS